MKGQGFSFIFGLLIIVVTAAIFLFGVTRQYLFEQQIVSSSVEVYATEHVAEKLKRTIDADVAFLAASLLPDLAEEGGGFKVWTATGPTEGELAEELSKRIAKELVIDISGLEGRVISRGEPAINIRTNPEGFVFSGQLPFKVESILTNPQVRIESSGGFEGNVATSYFRLAVEGRRVAGQCAAVELGDRKVDELTLQVANASTGGQLLYAVSVTDPAEPLALSFMLNCTG